MSGTRRLFFTAPPLSTEISLELITFWVSGVGRRGLLNPIVGPRINARQCSDRSHAPVKQYERFLPKRWYSSFGSVAGKWVSTTVLTPAVCCHFPDFFRCEVFLFLMPNRACVLLGRHRLPAAAFDLALFPLLYRRHLRN